MITQSRPLFSAGLLSSKEERLLAYVSSRPEHQNFLVVEWEGIWVPEARSYPQNILPHQVSHNKSVFPVAEVVEEPEEKDVEP